ncbi:glycoside hydrolase family 76 protein [Arthrobacter agilis]|uniref:glycoside hydrolase family 76 protein n=1 Tax=Arthrobacter agilis TaxID=37921 RepID=UPI00278173BB|nr:glycoside hydrolase family 76 protein [Arthrobacter agilis]MDQ0737026.1 putative alpha-1,6-mannanase (GH76 family) [Arthrobacter agilis]
MPIPDDAASLAASSVRRLYARRSLRVPGTRLGAIAFPPPTDPRSHWHYWWQAHYLDCLLDEHLRDPLGDGLGEARKLARGIWLRNGGRWRNAYYDDMAWLALALQRLGAVEGRRRLRRRARVLGGALASAHTPDLGGGVYWNTTRDYKNTPSTAPAALFFARAGDTARAQELLDWLRSRLYDPVTGLYLDGVKADGSAEGTVERTVHTYNQGTVLGALVATGGGANLGHAARLVEAVAGHLAGDDGVLPLSGGGDAGLFTGILARYLASTVRAPGMDPQAAATARGLLGATAERLWADRTEVGGPQGRSGQAGTPALLFPPRQDGPVSLSSQLQAWMVLEAERACRHRIVRH